MNTTSFRRLTRSVLAVVLASVVALTAAGCSTGPSEEVVAAAQAHESKLELLVEARTDLAGAIARAHWLLGYAPDQLDDDTVLDEVAPALEQAEQVLSSTDPAGFVIAALDDLDDADIAAVLAVADDIAGATEQVRGAEALLRAAILPGVEALQADRLAVVVKQAEAALAALAEAKALAAELISAGSGKVDVAELEVAVAAAGEVVAPTEGAEYAAWLAVVTQAGAAVDKLKDAIAAAQGALAEYNAAHPDVPPVVVPGTGGAKGGSSGSAGGGSSGGGSTGGSGGSSGGGSGGGAGVISWTACAGAGQQELLDGSPTGNSRSCTTVDYVQAKLAPLVDGSGSGECAWSAGQSSDSANGLYNWANSKLGGWRYGYFVYENWTSGTGAPGVKVTLYVCAAPA